MPSRRRFLFSVTASTAAAALAGVAPSVLAQAGGKPARIIVGAAAGGGSDVIARLLAEKLRGSYAPSVIVDNRPGANGQIAVDLIKGGESDGSLMLLTPDFRMTVFPHSHRKLSYDPLRDFVPVAICSKSAMALSAGPMLPAGITTLAGFLQWAKANPKQALYATTSAGGTPHLSGVMLSRAAGVELTPVHYKGGAPALQDLLAGQAPVAINPEGEVLPHARSGRIRVLAVTGAQRSRFLPEVATMIESGFRDIMVEAWLGFFVVAKTPPETVARLGAAIGGALKAEGIAESFARAGMDVAYAGPEQFAAILRADIDRWGPIVRASGFVAD